MNQPNVQQMMQQVQQMQQQMAEAQAKLEAEEISVTAGGGSVTVVITGGLEVRSVTIDPEAIDPEAPELLQDAVTAAVNQAIAEAKAKAEKQMGGVTGGLDLNSLGLGNLGL